MLADTYELPGTALGLGGAFTLSDKQVLFLILEKLKARSMDDFVTRLQSIRFLEEDTNLDFTKQYHYEKLFRAALNFRFRFVMRVQLLGSRAKAEHIPPLQKMGQTPGLLTFFFNAWPAGTGKALFSRHFTPEMKAQTDLKGFFKLFFAKLNTYRDVKQGYDDLGSVLSSQQRDRDGDVGAQRQREDRPYLKRERDDYQALPVSQHPQQEESSSPPRERKNLRPPGYNANKRIWTPESERRDFRPRLLQHMRTEDAEEFEEHEADEDDRPTLEGRLSDSGVEMVNAIERDREDRQRGGCFWKYMYGECTKKDCSMDHREETIQGMWKKKVWDLAKAVKNPGGETLILELQRALRDAQASTNSNTRV